MSVFSFSHLRLLSIPAFSLRSATSRGEKQIVDGGGWDFPGNDKKEKEEKEEEEGGASIGGARKSSGLSARIQSQRSSAPAQAARPSGSGC